MSIYQKVQITRSEIIAKEIAKCSKGIDKKIDDTFKHTHHVIHGLHFAWNAKFLLTRSFAKVKPLPKFFITQYDYYTLFLPELGIIRALRYMGKRDLSANEIFLIRRLQIQRDETSRLGQELLGCFISYGQVDLKEEINYDLLLLEYFFLNLIKPLAVVDRNFSAILPTPFSTVSILIESDVVFLVPCTALILIDYTKARETRGNILGEVIDYIETEGYTICCKYDEKSPKMVKCYIIGPFKVVIPKIEQVDEQLYHEYYENRDPVITNLAGIIVFGSKPLLPSLNLNDFGGFILVFCEVPYSLDVSAFIHLGESINIIDKEEKYRLNGIKLKIEKKLFEIFRNKVFKTIDYIRRNNNAKEQIIDFEKVTSKNYNFTGWLERVDNCVYLYAPPLITLSLVHKIKFNELLQVMEKFTKRDTGLDIILENRYKHKIWLKILNLENFLKVWYETFNTHRVITEKYKLFTLL